MWPQVPCRLYLVLNRCWWWEGGGGGQAWDGKGEVGLGEKAWQVEAYEFMPFVHSEKVCSTFFIDGVGEDASIHKNGKPVVRRKTCGRKVVGLWFSCHYRCKSN